MDVHNGTGNIFFAGLLEKDDPNYHNLVVLYLSDDNGATWDQCVGYSPWGDVYDVACAVLDNYVYLAYTSADTTVKVQRFLASDGSPATHGDGSTIATALTTFPPYYFREIVLVSNEDVYSTPVRRLFLFGLDDRAVEFAIGSDNGWDWNDWPDNEGLAERGLSATINAVYGSYSSHYDFLLSYVDKYDNLRIDGYKIVSGWDLWLVTEALDPGAGMTGISAHNDTVWCVYEDMHLSSRAISYRRSSTGGDSWSLSGSLFGSEPYRAPAITLRNGGGIGLGWQQGSIFRDGMVRFREYDGTSWDGALVEFSDNFVFGRTPVIEYLGKDMFGLAYIGLGGPSPQAAYFDAVSSCCEGIRGNVDGDSGEGINVADVTFLVAYLFQGGDKPECYTEADTNGDPSWSINVADLTFLVGYLFQGGSAPAGCP